MIIKREIIEQLNKELSLPYLGIEQDWDIEMGNPHRLNNFINFYRQNRNKLSPEKKVAVMALIFASYDNFLDEKNLKIDNRWEEIKSILESEKCLFSDLINYWSLDNEIDEDNLFCLTSLLRNVK